MKKYIGTGAVIISIVLVYIFISYFRDYQKQNYIFNKQKECRNICETVYKNEEESVLERKGTMFNPLYFYNLNKNTCYYYGGFMDSFSWTKHIINCLTNEEVLYSMQVGDEIFGATDSELDKKKNELMK